MYWDMRPWRCGGGEGVVRSSSSSGGGGAAYAGAGWLYTTSP